MGSSHSSLVTSVSAVPSATALVPGQSAPTILPSSTLHSAVVFSDDFEGSAPQFNHSRYRVDGGGSITAVTKPVFHGQQSAKFTVPNDGVSWRSEIAKNSLGYGSFSVSFVNYLPTDWVDTSVNTIVAQWHGFQLTNGQNTNPPIALSVKDMRWLLVVHHLENPSDSKPKAQWYDLGQTTKGTWTQWDFRIDWSRPEVNGTVTVMLNDKTVVVHKGSNNYHQTEAPYFKQGIYRPNWNPDKGLSYLTGGPSVVVYCDDLVVTKLHE
ncbi:hypothetical protein MHUMG1_08765 [Metarhizium humberi]|uniref:Uncharacterized protein n=1 Tax=Metarhizium humberi TaxID=2596975 RepID=A0A9P8S4D3_9HYPO|nr:hypothetical protein MHUMG1_08765 [Metarhizium humberi]